MSSKFRGSNSINFTLNIENILNPKDKGKLFEIVGISKEVMVNFRSWLYYVF